MTPEQITELLRLLNEWRDDDSEQNTYDLLTAVHENLPGLCNEIEALRRHVVGLTELFYAATVPASKCHVPGCRECSGDNARDRLVAVAEKARNENEQKRTS